MSTVDTAWLRMDSPRNLMVIVGIMQFRTPVAPARLEELIRARMLAHRRFRQKVEPDAPGYSWVDDEHFRLERHLPRVRMKKGDDAALRRLAARLATRRFDPAHPLWQMHFVGGPREVHAIVVRMHHCIADGIALVRVLLTLADDAPAARSLEAAGRVTPGAGLSEHDPHPWDAWLHPVTRGAIAAIGATGSGWSHLLEILRQPDRLVDHAHAGSRLVTDALDILLMSDDTATRLKGRPRGRKALAWNEPLALDEVKSVCRALGASVNDVLLACVAGALRRHLQARGDPVAHDHELRAMVPVNLRGDGDGIELGNRFGLVPLCLPIGIDSPIERVREIRRRMEQLKGGYQPVLAYALLAVVGAFPQLVQDPILEYLACKATAVMTNVPGPRAPIRMAGSEISRLMVWVPQAGDIGLGIAILSYAQGVQFGVIADTSLCADPQAIVDGFAPEFERLVLALALLPNGMLIDRDLAPGELEHILLEPA